MMARRNNGIVLFAMLAAGVGLWGCNFQLGALTSGGEVHDPGPGDDGDGMDAGTQRNLVVFFDPDSNFSTTDVHDVDEEIVQFDADTLEIVWAADDQGFDAGDWSTDGNFLGTAQFFQVRFGTKDGQRMAYFTETDPPTICQIEVQGDDIRISRTNERVPQE